MEHLDISLLINLMFLLSFLISCSFVLLRLLVKKELELEKIYEVDNLDDCIFTNSTFINSTLKDLSIKRATFKSTNLTNTVFLKVDLTKSDFTGAIFNNTKFIECVIAGVYFSEEQKRNCIMINCITKEQFNPDWN